MTIKDRVGLRASLMNIMLCHLRCDINYPSLIKGWVWCVVFLRKRSCDILILILIHLQLNCICLDQDYAVSLDICLVKPKSSSFVNLMVCTFIKPIASVYVAYAHAIVSISNIQKYAVVCCKGFKHFAFSNEHLGRGVTIMRAGNMLLSPNCAPNIEYPSIILKFY